MSTEFHIVGFQIGRETYGVPIASLHEIVRAYHLANFGPEHENTLTAMQNLSAAYYSAGRFEEARKLQEELLALLGQAPSCAISRKSPAGSADWSWMAT